MEGTNHGAMEPMNIWNAQKDHLQSFLYGHHQNTSCEKVFFYVYQFFFPFYLCIERYCGLPFFPQTEAIIRIALEIVKMLFFLGLVLASFKRKCAVSYIKLKPTEKDGFSILKTAPNILGSEQRGSGLVMIQTRCYIHT